MKRTKQLTYIPTRLHEADEAGSVIKGKHPEMMNIMTPGCSFNILTNDPSFTAWGWAVIDGKTSAILKTGCIKTKTEGKKRRIRKGDETVQRTGEIDQVILGLIKKYKISYILTELPHGSQNASGALMIGIVIGLLKMLSDTLEIGIEWYSERDSKKCLLGKISATKIETMIAIDKLYDVPITKGIGKNRKGEIVALWSGVGYIDEAVADALAIYNVAMKESSTLKLMKR